MDANTTTKYEFANFLVTKLYSYLPCLIIDIQKMNQNLEYSLLGGLEAPTFRLIAERSSQLLQQSCSLVPCNYSR